MTRGSARLLATIAEEAQEKEEKIDEVEIEGERAYDGIGAELPLRQGERHLFQPLGVPGGKSGEDDHAHHRDQVP
jgi:hypothetical protein